MSPDLERPLAAPGRYEVVVEASGARSSAVLAVLPDPRVPYRPEVFAANLDYRRRLEAMQDAADAAVATLACVEGILADAQSLPLPALTELRATIESLWEVVDFPGIQGTVSDSPRLMQRLAKALYYSHSPYESLSVNDRLLLESLQTQSDAFQRRFADFERLPSVAGTDCSPR